MKELSQEHSRAPWADLPDDRPDGRLDHGIEPSQVKKAIDQARDFLFSLQREDYHWCAELESNTTITSEYLFLCQMLGIPFATHQEKMVRYLLSRQKGDGSWGISNHFEGDISTTAETYLALRILGVEDSREALKRAEKYILSRGGLEKIRIFTRIFFAMFGLIPWAAIPAIPPEFIFLPSRMPVNIYALSSWARGTMIPLFIISHHRPVFALPNGKSPQNTYLDHLWLNPADKNIPYSASWMTTVRAHGISWRSLFTAADGFLKIYERSKLSRLRERALKKCERWILEHQESSGDWAGIFPPMLNSVIALTLRGYALDSEPLQKGIDAIHRFSWEDAEGYRIQACVSPVWDTVLGAVGILDGGHDRADPRLAKAMEWIRERQIRVDYGDWKVYNPNGISGGWAFEYENSWYPDVDDTAAVVLALLKQDPSCAQGETVSRAVEWMLSMQNRDGGWAAFDLNNDRLFLNEIPFSDMNSLCDTSCPDVTGRVLEAFGVLENLTGRELPFSRRIAKANRLAVQYLRAQQEIQGSWFGRWGVNYIYGTSNVLCGLARIRLSSIDPMVERGVEWLKHVQNEDGGWGEGLESYADKRWMGKGESTASQTAWAVMGLLSYLPPQNPAIARGVRWLIRRQKQQGEQGATWKETQFTGTGFPNHFYLRYHLYRHYFPMMALGRYWQALQN